jgi:hypothetical protein
MTRENQVEDQGGARRKLPVFITWAEERSKAVALTLRKHIPMLLQNADPWVSARDIGSGERWSPVIAARLNITRFGILCLTPENVDRPWIHFEAGAIAKAMNEDARVCPYLFGFARPTDVPQGPLSQFQGKLATKDDTADLLRDLNKAMGAEGIERDQLEELFELIWPKIKADLDKIPKVPPTPTKERGIEQMVPEILETVRSLERRLPPSVLDEPRRFRYRISGVKPEDSHTVTEVVTKAFLDKFETVAISDSDPGPYESIVFVIKEPIRVLGADFLLELIGLSGLQLSDSNGVVLAKSPK